MGFDSARAAIEGRLLANWTLTSGSPPVTSCRTPIALENTDGWITKPDGTVGLTAAPASAWIRCTIREGAGLQKDLNPSPRVRVVGIIWIQVFVSRGTGTAGAKALGDLLVPIFQRATFGGIHCRAAEVQERGEDQQWWAYDVRFPYYRDEISN